MPQPTLDERFQSGPPTRGADEFHNWLSAEERRFILWALNERWSARRIGRALGVNEATVRRFRRSFWENPDLLLELRLHEMVGRARDQEFRCLVCADHVLGRQEVERHVLRHFLDETVVQQARSSKKAEPEKAGEALEVDFWGDRATDDKDDTQKKTSNRAQRRRSRARGTSTQST